MLLRKLCIVLPVALLLVSVGLASLPALVTTPLRDHFGLYSPSKENTASTQGLAELRSTEEKHAQIISDRGIEKRDELKGKKHPSGSHKHGHLDT